MDSGKRLKVVFYKTESGIEPVRDWLKKLGRPDSILIGEDVRMVEFGWPIGMPTCKSIGKRLFEIRTNLPGNRTSRILFFIEDKMMYLLHGFIKKSQKIPQSDLNLALKRRREMEKK